MTDREPEHIGLDPVAAASSADVSFDPIPPCQVVEKSIDERLIKGELYFVCKGLMGCTGVLVTSEEGQETTARLCNSTKAFQSRRGSLVLLPRNTWNTD